ncbi:hypothetical protein BSKO_13235 [Bryopsis sp. KO-2023]|nr:hypothetical protein BSKO_13235 [Bryopsis sp. KO-2023]
MEHPNNTPTYDKWFAYADSDEDGRLSGPDAVKFFERSGLPRDILAKVWGLADSKREGFLGRFSFHKAMELISMAQHGKELDPDAHMEALREGIAAPRMDGMEAITAGMSATQIPANKTSYDPGKTTFIKHLLGRDYPGAHIGPEPTTDRFVVCMQGFEERRTPGNTLAVQPDMPYQGLQMFGTGFLSRFECAQCPSKLLDEITLVDTPGVLSGEKQRVERQYDFIGVCEWFASRCDLILLLFDPYKLDISDEFKKVINALKGHDDKIRVVLNKGDQVSQQQLMRVYGALMWSLGKVFRSPEVCRVYIGSFNAGKEIETDKNPYAKELFEAEQANLLHDLFEIPQRSCDRKVNEFVKRVRAAKIHILLIGHLRKQLPSMFGKKSASNKVLDNLHEHFDHVRREHQLAAGDFPDVSRFRQILQSFDLASFPKTDKKMLKTLEEVLSVDLPALVKQFHNPYE